MELVRRQVLSRPSAELAGALADATKHQKVAACESFPFLLKCHLPGATESGNCCLHWHLKGFLQWRCVPEDHCGSARCQLSPRRPQGSSDAGEKTSPREKTCRVLASCSQVGTETHQAKAFIFSVAQNLPCAFILPNLTQLSAVLRRLRGWAEASEEAGCPQPQSGFGSAARTAQTVGLNSPCPKQRPRRSALDLFGC